MTTSEFLSSIGFIADGSNNEDIASAFDAEIRAALEGRASSLRMLPAELGSDIRLVANKAAVIDAGGTNLRVAEVEIGTDGSEPVFRNVRKTFMPGTHGRLTADAFHAAIAREAEAVFAAEGVDRLGYCFSYECRSLPNGDAELLAWSKQVDAPEVVGQRVGEELAKRLSKPPQSVKVLNDTVATLLAGCARVGSDQASGYLGFILGTGTNVACSEAGMLRNAESGEFNRLRRSTADLALDGLTADPGCAVFEKMVAGAYLGNLGLCLFREAARAGLFAEGTEGRLAAIPALETRDLDLFAVGELPAALTNLFAADDLATARELARAVFQRAAHLTAAHLAAFLRRKASPDASKPVVITADGSTFWKTKAVSFEQTLVERLSSLSDIPPFRIVCVDEAPMVGAAVAACMG